MPTGLPLAHEPASLTQPFVDHGFDVAKVFYFGESVLLPDYRGHGIGVGFFREREAHAHTSAASARLLRASGRPSPAGRCCAARRLQGAARAAPIEALVGSISWRRPRRRPRRPSCLQFWCWADRPSPLAGRRTRSTGSPAGRLRRQVTAWVEGPWPSACACWSFPSMAGWSWPPCSPSPCPATCRRSCRRWRRWRPRWSSCTDLARRHGVHIPAPACRSRWRRHHNRLAVRPGRGLGFPGQDRDDPLRARELERLGASELRLFDTELGRLGVCICYDVEFPLLARALVEAGRSSYPRPVLHRNSARLLAGADRRSARARWRASASWFMRRRSVLRHGRPRSTSIAVRPGSMAR